MADRANCVLDIFGLVSVETLANIEHLLKFWLGPDYFEEGQEIEFPFYVEEVRDAQLPLNIVTFMMENDVSYKWSWEAGVEFSEGALLNDAHKKVVHEVNTLDGDIVMKVHDIDTPEALETAKSALDYATLAANTGLFLYKTQGDYDAAIANEETMAAFYKR
jgi:hypothetical protein